MTVPAHGESRSQRGRDRRALWLLAAIVIALVAAAASGLVHVRDAHPRGGQFPHEIACPSGTDVCTAGRSAGAREFTLVKVATTRKRIHVVGAGADTGDGTSGTPLICTVAAHGLQCGPQPARGEQRFALYLPD
jgi:hypothetical protein